MGRRASRKRESEERPRVPRRSKAEVDHLLDSYKNDVVGNGGSCPYCGKDMMRLNSSEEYTFKMTRATVVSHADETCRRHKRAAPAEQRVVEVVKEVLEQLDEQQENNDDDSGDSRNEDGTYLDDFATHENQILEFQEELKDYSDHWYDIAGTQYDGRDYRLSMCDDEELVILQKEPDNSHDSNAVRLYRLSSYPEHYSDLGFIPSDQNYEFRLNPSPIVFGRIRYTEGEENYCRGWKRKRWTKYIEREVYLLRSPDAPTICPLPIPIQLVETCRNMVGWLNQANDPEWVRFKDELIAEQENTCVYSGLKCDTLEPIFSFLSRSKTMRLEGFTLAHPCLRNVLYIDHAASSRMSSVELITGRISLLNPDISVEEARRIYSKIVQVSHDRLGWRIDTSKFHFTASCGL